MASKNFDWFDKRLGGKRRVLQISDQHFHKFAQARMDFETSKTHIFNTYIHLWNNAVKSHLLHAGDRKMYLKDWQSNVHLGLIRSVLDTYTSFLTQSPLQWDVVGIDKEANMPIKGDKDGATPIQHMKDALGYIADVTRLNRQIALAMQEGVIFGWYIFKTGYYNNDKETIKSVGVIDGAPVDIEFQDNKANLPYTTCIDPYTVFPDFFGGKEPSYVAERSVITVNSFMKIFAPMIARDDNEIKIKAEDIPWILQNKNTADFVDYSDIRSAIFFHQNQKAFASDSLYNAERSQNLPAVQHETFSDNDKVEFVLTTYEDRIVLRANGYPMYIGKNFYGCINYTFGQAYETRGLVSESVSYLLQGTENTQNSFFNNTLDNARSAAVHRYLRNRKLITGDINIQNVPPGGVIDVDGNPRDALALMETPRVTDFNIMSLSDFYAQKLSGVSEINQGVASKLRTASEASALVGSTNRVMNQFTQRFSMNLGGVGEMSIKFARQLWTEEQYGMTPDIDGKRRAITVKNTDLAGSFFCTLDGQGLFAMNREMQLEIKQRMFDRFKAVMEPEQLKIFMRDIMREAEMNPNIFMPMDATVRSMEKANPSELGAVIGGTGGAGTPADFAQLATAAVSPQPNLGNGGEGNA